MSAPEGRERARALLAKVRSEIIGRMPEEDRASALLWVWSKLVEESDLYTSEMHEILLELVA